MSQSQWPMPQTPMSSNMVSAQNQPWEQHPASTDCLTWTSLPNELLTDHSMPANGDLLYSHDARQGTLDKPMHFERLSFWTSNSMNIVAPSPSADMLLSPVSSFSDAKNTYSPIPDCTPAIFSSGSASYTMSPGAVKVSSSPGFVPPIPQSVTRQQPGSVVIQNGFGVPMTPAGPFNIGNMVEQTDDVTMYGSEHSYENSQSSSPGLTPWLPPGYTGEKAAIAQGSQQRQPSTPPFDRRPNSFFASLDPNSRQRQAQWSNTSAIPAQSHFQSRFMTPRTDNEKAQRAKDDEVLLQMKQDGYTYRDIRKALGRKVAESTLRGRYRSLTKPRNARVRAPKWTETDVSVSSAD